MSGRLIAAAALVAGVAVLALVLRPAFEPTPPLTLSVQGTDVVVVTARPAFVHLEYGRTRRYGLFSAPQGPVMRHEFTLASLPPGSTWHVRAVADGTRTSADATLRLPPHPGRAARVGTALPAAWHALVQASRASRPRGLDRALETFAPALAAPPMQVMLENMGTAIYATRRNGAVTIFAVNTSPAQAVQQVFDVPGLAGRSVRVWNTGRELRGSTGSFADTLPPFAWRVYLVPPLR